MKRLLLLLVLATAAILGGGDWSAGQGIVAPAPASPAPGPNSRYYAVQQKLDQGGSFYLYCDLKDQLKQLMGLLRPYVMKPGMPPDALRIYAIADRVLERLGIYGIHDLGVSVISEGELNRSKCFVSAPEGRERGILGVLGGAPHPLALLDRASSATLVVATGDFDVPAVWALVRQIASDIGGVNGTTMIDKRFSEIKQRSGLDFEAMINSLGGEFAFYLDQDPAFKLVVPLGPSNPLMVDTPRLALLAKVKDATIYNAIKGLLQIAQVKMTPEATEGKLNYFQITLPPNPVWVVSPTLGFDGEYFYIASHVDLARQLAGPAKSPLSATAEYQKLMAGMPTEGNGASYVSPRLGAIVRNAMQQIIAATPGAAPKARGELIMDLVKNQAGTASVRVNQPDGVLTIGRSKGGGAQYMGAMLMVPVGVAAAVAMPRLLEAKAGGGAKISRVKGDMRTMTIALETYYLDQNNYPAWAVPPDPNANGLAARPDQPTFRVKRDPSDPLMTLTTPISYISSYFPDPFAPAQGNTFSYWSPAKGAGYILWSPGPDGKYDLNLNNIGQVYNPAAQVPSPGLLGLTFDPTNGAKSPGDIYRYKQ